MIKTGGGAGGRGVRQIITLRHIKGGGCTWTPCMYFIKDKLTLIFFFSVPSKSNAILYLLFLYTYYFTINIQISRVGGGGVRQIIKLDHRGSWGGDSVW